MGSIDDIMQLCRLCLVKDQVNIPIFDEASDIRQTFLKINSCLPVKVSQDDNLPKKICDGCSYKLDMLYIFRNTSVDSEKQLLSWLNQAGLGACSLPQSAVKDGGTKPEIMVKQETFESTDSRIEEENPEMCADAHSYIIQQQKLPYQQEFGFGEASGSTEMVVEEPAPKRAKRAAAMKKHVPIETDEDELDTAMQITKAEEDDSDDIDQPDYVEAPSTSADDQPGPSGVGKGAIEAPSVVILPKGITVRKIGDSAKIPKEEKSRKTHGGAIPFNMANTKYFCSKCQQVFESFQELTAHSLSGDCPKPLYICKYCDKRFANNSSLKAHLNRHEEGIQHYCSKCGKPFANPFTRDLHLEMMHTAYYDATLSGFSCKLCDTTTPNRNTILKHINSKHHHITATLCHICGKCFDSESKLKLHTSIHRDDKPFECQVCLKNFKTKTSLTFHMRTHDEERVYVCDECGKTFKKSFNLNEHKKRHAGNFSFHCEICNKKFVSQTSLSAHLRNHKTSDNK